MSRRITKLYRSLILQQLDKQPSFVTRFVLFLMTIPRKEVVPGLGCTRLIERYGVVVVFLGNKVFFFM